MQLNEQLLEQLGFVEFALACSSFEALENKFHSNFFILNFFLVFWVGEFETQLAAFDWFLNLMHRNKVMQIGYPLLQ